MRRFLAIALTISVVTMNSCDKESDSESSPKYSSCYDQGTMTGFTGKHTVTYLGGASVFEGQTPNAGSQLLFAVVDLNGTGTHDITDGKYSESFISGTWVGEAIGGMTVTSFTFDNISGSFDLTLTHTTEPDKTFNVTFSLDKCP